MFLLAIVVLTSQSSLQAEDKPADKTDSKSKQKPDSKDNQDEKNPKAGPANPFPNRPKAPSLDGGETWLNTSGEITLKDLRGKIVLMDFWTYCCINCIHVLPDLKYLEKKFPNELVVIGVHSAKFDTEKGTENIRRAIQRYEIEHPVINDANMIVWRKFNVRSWPTMVLLDPEGNYLGHLSGEGNREILEQVIKKLIDYHDFKGTLDRTPIQFDLETDKLKNTPLKFPGKILADEKNNRLFISDSNHNRIVISTLGGKLIDIIGAGTIGAKDGSYAEATFDHPQGMEVVGDTLYVADTENHLLRTVNLKTKTVSTLAGTGLQDRRRTPGGPLLKTALNSPWALSHVDGILYIAMAGPHQMWKHKLGSGTVETYAGSGREDIINGPLASAALAQPSGIATDGKTLYICDSEGSSIRRINIAKGEVTTVVGTSELPNGRCLFEFGDVDGIGADVRLQHPLGVVHHDGFLYVADTYNHKIKKIDLKKKKSTTWLGTGKVGTNFKPAQFSEPAGLTLAAGKLFIADTNNHRIVTADLKTGQVADFVVQGLKPPKPQKTKASIRDPKAKVTAIKPQTVIAGKSLNFEIDLKLPESYKLNKLAPVVYKLVAQGEQKLIAAGELNARKRAKISQPESKSLSVSVPLSASSGTGTYELSVSFGYCREGTGGLCKLKTAYWKIPVTVSADGKQTVIKLEATAK